MTSIAILERLIAFPTVSQDSNLALIDYARELLANFGIDSVLVHDETGKKANLFATIGSHDRPGIVLSGHTDVVPVEGQSWTVDPFKLTRRDGQLFGRGTADIKGFVACALHVACSASERDLKTPLHIALSYDEEIGCVGVRRLIDMLEQAPLRPAFCLVGEPTSMAVATGHKGKIAARAHCIGREGHSALAPLALNAIHLACDFIAEIRKHQSDLVAHGAKDGDYDVPYTTLHAGKIGGGVALNIVPNRCELDFEIRNVAADDPKVILSNLRAAAAHLVDVARRQASEADIGIEIVNTYPGLDTPADAAIVAFVKSLTGANRTTKVAFGTEGGLFTEKLGIPVAICSHLWPRFNGTGAQTR